MRPSQFLTALWGQEPPGLIHLWRLSDKRSYWYRAPDVDARAEGRPDIYTGVALAHADHGPHRRLKADEAIAIAGLWLDLDVAGGPECRDHGAPSKTAAAELADAVIEPTLLVNSGHGVHAWHLLERPWRFASRAEQQEAATMAAQWYALHHARAREAGWHLDTSTRDLARLMRLPGTVNAKGGQSAPVSVIASDGPRYTRARLREETSAAGLPATEYNRSPSKEPKGTAEVGELRFRRGAAPPADKLRALLVNSPEFAATWQRQRPDLHDDQSAHDLALANLAVLAGWTDQEITDLIGTHRGWDAKCFRTGSVRGHHGYIAATIARAREALGAAA